MTCPDVRARFEGYAAESLGASERRALREHLAECRSCREEAGAFDPGLLFAVVRPEEVSAEEVARVLSAVRTGIDLKNAERKLGIYSLGRRHVGTVAGAAVVVALTLAVPGARAPRSERPVTAVASMQNETHPMPARAEGLFLPMALPDLPAEAGLAKAGSSQKQKFPADATIYDWNPGGGEPRVFWIVDRSLDI